jgi:hypothetical protein
MQILPRQIEQVEQKMEWKGEIRERNAPLVRDTSDAPICGHTRLDASSRSNAPLAAAQKKHHNQIKSVEQGSCRHCPTGTPPRAPEKERGTEGKGTHRWSPGGARPRQGSRRRARAARAPTRGAAAGPPPGTAGGPAPPPLPWPSRPLPGLSNRRK